MSPKTSMDGLCSIFFTFSSILQLEIVRNVTPENVDVTKDNISYRVGGFEMFS